MRLHLRKTRLALAAAVAMVGMTGAANAATIALGSTINFAGQSTCTVTSCSFGNVIVTSGTGSFSNFTFGTPATFFSLAVTPYTDEKVYTSTNTLGETTSFSTSSRLKTSVQTVDGLTSYLINDAGLMQLTGFDATPGSFAFSANQNGSVLGSFSATSATIASAAPEPATWAMMILGFGFTGLCLRSARRPRGIVATI